MTKIRPAGAARELVEFSKRKCARGRCAAVVLRHPIAKDKRGQKINADGRERSAAQIGDENEFARELAATLQHADSVLFAEVVKHERTEHNVVRLGWLPIEHV